MARVPLGARRHGAGAATGRWQRQSAARRAKQFLRTGGGAVAASAERHARHSASRNGWPGRTKRYCVSVLNSVTEKSSRVAASTGTIRFGTPSSSMRRRSMSPVAPPAGRMASTSPPNRLTTRATLMPPPPGSRRCVVQRSLSIGTTRSTAVDTSIAGLGVRVTTFAITAEPMNSRAAAWPATAGR